MVNQALGYTIRYQLENFTYDFNSHYLLYAGYPLFEPLKGRKGQLKRWQRQRGEAFDGSVMHFMRAVYRNRIRESCFLVYRLKKRLNLEKQRVKTILQGQAVKWFDNGRKNALRSGDALFFYRDALYKPPVK